MVEIVVQHVALMQFGAMVVIVGAVLEVMLVPWGQW